MPFDKIAALLDRSPAAAKKLARRAILALPSGPSRQHPSPIGYQGDRKQPARRPANGQHRVHHAR